MSADSTIKMLTLLQEIVEELRKLNNKLSNVEEEVGNIKRRM